MGRPGLRATTSARAVAVAALSATGLTCARPGAQEDTSSSSSTESTGGTGGEDSLPPTPTLASPADGATDVALSVELCWNPVEDPDGEPVRYRVFVDDTELVPGQPGDAEGYEGPCAGPLTFAHETTYAWQVQAFEAEDPDRASARSEAWTFTVEDDGLSQTVFEDDFEEDLGWAVAGDATSGAWTHGKPVGAADSGEPSQPGRCAGGEGCYFTGQNPGGVADEQDVAGGSTILTSPAFDLSGAAAATVQVGRFFYKSEPGAGPHLQVELLVPDDGAPGGFAGFELELLQSATADAPANAWTPREYAACGVPMEAGSRLRITAADPGTGILEAALDSVSVHAHDVADLCGSGEGGICDPEAGPAACPDPLLCCAQGVTNAGVYRCAPAVAGLDFDAPPPTADSPGNGAPGCDAPDLVVDTQWIEPAFTDIFVSDTTCELFEGCVGGKGWRTIMRFTVGAANIGSADLALGVPANHPELFDYSACHSHWHFDEFARYELRDAQDVVASGHKQAFCLLDTISWAWPAEIPQFDCANQGVSRGFTDFYESDLPCQWIDVTDVAPGDYTLRISLNQPRPGTALPVLNERDYANNEAIVPVTVP